VAGNDAFFQIFGGRDERGRQILVVPGPNQPDPEAPPATAPPSDTAPPPAASPVPSGLAATGIGLFGLWMTGLAMLVAGFGMLLLAGAVPRRTGNH